MSAALPISEQRRDTTVTPAVSILVPVFNHEHYLRPCIDSILMQETTFPVEIIIREDASIDKSAQILKEYEDRHPGLFRIRYETENQWSKGVRAGPVLLSMSWGSYIAICEGDDYWTDKHKLQKQYNYMQYHPRVVLTFHDVMSVDNQGEMLALSKIEVLGAEMQPQHLEDFGSIAPSLIPSASVMFRNYPVKIGSMGMKITNGDTYIYAMLARYGVMHNMGETMGVHRSHDGGVWSSKNEQSKLHAQLKTLEAIAYEIDALNAPVAGRHLSTLAWRGFCVSCRKYKCQGILDYTRYFLEGILCCFRSSAYDLSTLPQVVATVMGIWWIPFGAVIKVGMRVLLKPFSGKSASA